LPDCRKNARITDRPWEYQSVGVFVKGVLNVAHCCADYRALSHASPLRGARYSLTYSWFSEGFDTADLKDAKLLLDDLSQ